MATTRRRFVRDLAGTGAWLTIAAGCADEGRLADLLAEVGGGSFEHGVASGDPLTDRVILWTRVTPVEDGPVEVEWVIARDPGLTDVVSRGGAGTSADRDYTVKVDADGLAPATTYYYRFSSGDRTSPVGRTRTLPTGSVDRVRLAVVSCANYAHGFFSVYREVARRADLDAVVHLGDYFYEYGPGTQDRPELGRPHDPPREVVTLADYRTRYAQYRRDADLQELHRQHPMIAVWDDHEFTDDSHLAGAVNHNPEEGEGDWGERRAAAVRAYREWMPVRDEDPERIYRSFRFGDLADLMMLDTRFVGREPPPSGVTDRLGLGSSDRQLLGPEQEAWLLDRLDESANRGARWRLLGNQVPFAPVGLSGSLPLYLDGWDGYPAVRRRILEHVAGNDIDNLVVLTGDVHTSWALDISDDPFDEDVYDPETGAGSMGVELIGPSVTAVLAEGVMATIGPATVTATNPHLKWVDLTHHGYLLVDVDTDRVQADWYHVDSVEVPDGSFTWARSFATRSGENHLVEVADRVPERAAIAPFAP